MGAKFSPERLAKVRRMRKARRLFKNAPLFAYVLMRKDYPNYTDAEFVDDLCRRSKRKPRKRKTPLERFGRYSRMQQLLRAYGNSGDVETLLAAARLRKRMTAPYRVMAQLGGKRWEFTFSPLVRLNEIEHLTASLAACTTETDILGLVERFREMDKYN